MVTDEIWNLPLNDANLVGACWMTYNFARMYCTREWMSPIIRLYMYNGTCNWIMETRLFNMKIVSSYSKWISEDSTHVCVNLWSAFNKQRQTAMGHSGTNTSACANWVYTIYYIARPRRWNVVGSSESIWLHMYRHLPYEPNGKINQFCTNMENSSKINFPKKWKD